MDLGLPALLQLLLVSRMVWLGMPGQASGRGVRDLGASRRRPSLSTSCVKASHALTHGHVGLQRVPGCRPQLHTHDCGAWPEAQPRAHRPPFRHCLDHLALQRPLRARRGRAALGRRQREQTLVSMLLRACSSALPLAPPLSPPRMQRCLTEKSSQKSRPTLLGTPVLAPHGSLAYSSGQCASSDASSRATGCVVFASERALRH